MPAWKSCTCAAKANVLYSMSDKNNSLKYNKGEFNLMKEKYEVPVMEVIRFQSEDIITTSGVTVGPDPDVPDTGVDFE